MEAAFWLRVKSLLKANDLTQAELAKLAGVSYHTLRSWINNKRFPDVSSAAEMANVLGVRVEYLLLGKVKSGSRQGIKPLKSFLDRNYDSGNKNILVFKSEKK